MAKTNKDSFIIFRVTKEEKKYFMNKASELGQTVSNFMRKILKLDK